MTKPNFMCIGAPKCGTTSLYDILKHHSEIFLTPFKEPHFFDIDFNYSKGYKWYLNEYYSAATEQKIIGEFTPSYLIMPKVPERILNNIGGDIKFIVLLRNPVDRAYSQYLHSKRDMVEEFSFEESLSIEKERLAAFVKEEDDISYIRSSYISGGLYHNLLINFYKYFDSNNFKIIIFEDEFINNRKVLLDEIYEFLNIKKEELNLNILSNQAAGTRFTFIKNMIRRDSLLKRSMKKLIRSNQHRNKLRNFLQGMANKPIKKENLSQDLRVHIMNKHFINDIMKLEKLINRDLSSWYNYTDT